MNPDYDYEYIMQEQWWLENNNDNGDYVAVHFQPASPLVIGDITVTHISNGRITTSMSKEKARKIWNKFVLKGFVKRIEVVRMKKRTREYRSEYKKKRTREYRSEYKVCDQDLYNYAINA